MRGRFFIGIYWGSKDESVDECAARFAELLSRLKGHDDSFKHWFEQGDSRKEALQHEIWPVEEQLHELLAKGKSTAADQTWYMSAIWNGRPDGDAAKLQVTCGERGATANNLSFLYLPQPKDGYHRVVTESSVISMLTMMVECWEPDWGIVTHSALWKAVEPEAGAQPVGWLTYLSLKRGVIPPLPVPARVIPVEGRGNIIIGTNEPSDVENPQHVELLRDIKERLDKSGLLYFRK